VFVFYFEYCLNSTLRQGIVAKTLPKSVKRATKLIKMREKYLIKINNLKGGANKCNLLGIGEESKRGNQRREGMRSE